VQSQPPKKTAQPDQEPLKEPFFNITSISETAHVTISIDTPVVVPGNFTGLPVDIFDVQYFCNSDDPVALAQNFTYNLTTFTEQQIGIDLFFSDSLHVSSDSKLFDEIVVRLRKDYFANSFLESQRDLRWTYNNTHSRDDYYELREVMSPLVADEFEARVLATVSAVAAASLIVSIVLPPLVQLVIKGAMSKVWSIFNTL